MALSEALHRLNVDSFRGKQEDAVHSILTGRDVLYVFPTGAGMSLVYQVAALCSPNVTIVISPLIGLLHQQVQRLAEAGISVVEAYGESFALYGSMSDVKLVYTTPEQAKPGSELAKYAREHSLIVDRMVVDEAHLVNLWDEFRCGAVYLTSFTCKKICFKMVTLISTLL
jgi:ATP-dependent DNA helicase RecQ